MGNLKVWLNLARAARPKESGEGAFSTNAETFGFPPRKEEPGIYEGLTLFTQ
jgi:hypothetical protein